MLGKPWAAVIICKEMQSPAWGSHNVDEATDEWTNGAGLRFRAGCLKATPRTQLAADQGSIFVRQREPKLLDFGQ